jgi:hypothetical protein
MEQQGGESRRITIHKPEDFAAMRRAGKLAAETLDMITAHVRPGISTGEIDKLCHDYMVERGAIPATLGYRGYTKSSCTSVNHVVCHGIPGDRVLVDGDIINIDVTVILDGWHGDSSRMYVAGEASTKAKLLMDVTYDAMMKGIAQDFVKYVMHVQVVRNEETAPVVQNLQQTKSEAPSAVTQGSVQGGGDVPQQAAPVKQQPVVNDEWSKTPRNAPCPCGSGKKFKMCHGTN